MKRFVLLWLLFNPKVDFTQAWADALMLTTQAVAARLMWRIDHVILGDYIFNSPAKTAQAEESEKR